jgi:hypothetical protein
MFDDYLKSIDLLESAIKEANKDELKLLLANNTRPLYFIESFNYGIPIERSVNKPLYEGCKAQVLSEIKEHKEKLSRLKMFIDYTLHPPILTNPNEYILKSI